ncbi:hypothetical protein [Dendronalium sp. ChiSLP03b]|uniref:hypothetical protein n=1 Tax=Dendronalium sp. ChiSLP03b TaxID=3075381 RepID=UPI002AD54602|nr:hypothetical protein [Dendronalium sp. ChiSLP03b]MDZ8208954.1 hypothetical protein [Dendronalium sp. ChiSLP03b]
MNNNSNRKVNQDNQLAISPNFSSSLKKKYLITILTLVILSLLKISLKSDKINTNIWSFSVELKVTSVTLALVFLLWLPVLLPWFISLFPQLKSSLNWLRQQGIEEVETSLLKIKLRYGVEEASKNYEEKIWSAGSTNLTSEEIYQQVEKRYREAITLVNATSDIDSTEALKRIDQLGNYYDKVRDEMPSGKERTKLMREISSVMWALIPKTVDFPVLAKLNSDRGGERLSAYKYIEWQASTEYVNLLLSRAIGILETPFGQYAALLAIRRIVVSNKLVPTQAREIKDILNWSANLDYIGGDRQRLMVETVFTLENK